MTSLREVMAKDPLMVHKEATVADAAEAMVQGRVGSLLVHEDGTVVGILTERDVLRAAGAGGDLLETKVRDWMTRNPTTAPPDTDAAEAITTMLDGGYRHLPIAEEDEVIGIVSLRDLIGQHFGTSPRKGAATPDATPVASPAPVHERRERMFEATRQLQRRSRAPEGDLDLWRSALQDAVENVAEVIATHIDETEGPDGLYQELVRESGGRLTAPVARLKREHERSKDLLGELRDALAAGADPSTLRRAADRLYAQLEAHRHRGSDLLWQAYGVEIGVGD